MASPQNVAALVGPAIVALTSSEALNYHIWATNIPPVTYLNGTILFVGGVAILRAHDRWVLGWPVIVTLSGWFAVLGNLSGCSRLKPDRFLKHPSRTWGWGSCSSSAAS